MNRWCAYAEHVTDTQAGQTGEEKIILRKLTVSHYLAYLKNAYQSDETCLTNYQKNYRYYSQDTTTLRSLEFKWDEVRELLANNEYQTLYCFTGFGMESKVEYPQILNAKPTASSCSTYYPANSKWSLENLSALNKV